MSDSIAPEKLLTQILESAKRHGATSADALYVTSRSTEVRVRLGETEQVKQSNGKGVGLRVLIGDRTATTSSSDLRPDALDELIERTCAAAHLTASDPMAGLPDESLFEAPEGAEALELYDPHVDDLSVDEALRLATETESIARSTDSRITNSEGAEMGWGSRQIYLANSNGLMRSRRTSSASFWTTPIAETGSGMERDYWYTSARHLEDLADPRFVGEEAARRTIRRLGAKKPQTCKVPVVFESTVASRLLGALSGAINGGSVYRDATYLAGKLGESIAAPAVQITDDPRIVRGPASKSFDGEGLATRRHEIVKDGVLQTYLLDTYTARKLGLETTRHASRGLGGTPSPSSTNFWMKPGEYSLAELIGGIEKGLLVTELFGVGVNTITGDYSQGAVGVWIENGELTHAVSEFTIASTLPAIWNGIEAIGSDLDTKRATSAPSFRVDSMTVAGA